MTELEQIDQLKAQVNCLYKELDEVLDVIRDKLPTDDWSDFRFETIVQAIRTTPEHCLAEVKARAIEELIEKNTFSGYGWSNGTYFDSLEDYLKVYVSLLREQVK